MIDQRGQSHQHMMLCLRGMHMAAHTRQPYGMSLFSMVVTACIAVAQTCYYRNGKAEASTPQADLAMHILAAWMCYVGICSSWMHKLQTLTSIWLQPAIDCTTEAKNLQQAELTSLQFSRDLDAAIDLFFFVKCCNVARASKQLTTSQGHCLTSRVC